MQVGKRIIFEAATGKVVCAIGEMEGNVFPHEVVGALEALDIPFGQNDDEFKRAVSYSVDTVTKTIVFGELRPPETNFAEYVRDLENELLIARGLI